MVIKNLILKNFRNYSNLNIDFNSGMNIFIGENAQGKTNILESIYLLALTKSYKNGIEQNLIQFGKDKCKITSKVKKDKIIHKLEIQLITDHKILKVDQTEIKKVSDYISNLNVIMFTPEDLEIVQGSPNIRRNLLNMELSQISNKYLNTYNEYNKILKMRNEYLKLLLTSSIADKKYLDIITEKLIEKAIIIYQERKKYLDKINDNIHKIYQNITKESHLYVEYETNIKLENYEEEYLRKELKEVFYQNYKKELNYGMTLFGPHRDDFSFYLNDKNLKLFGSQGQKKVAILSFKLSEITIFEEYSRQKPVLLLDDIFSELDIKKRNHLLNYIDDNIQSIITTTDLKNIKKTYLENAYVFQINQGKVERRQ